MRMFAAAATVALATAAHAQWKYDSYPDEMSGGLTHRARVASSNTIDQPPPYGNGALGVLYVRRFTDQSMDVMYGITRGQLMCGAGDCTVRARFDDGAPVSFRASPPDDGSHSVVFIEDEKRFLRLAKGAKTIRIQAAVYQAGSPVMRFDLPAPLKDMGK